MDNQYQPLHPPMARTKATSFDWFEHKDDLLALDNTITLIEFLVYKNRWYRTFGPVISIGGHREENSI